MAARGSRTGGAGGRPRRAATRLSFEIALLNERLAQGNRTLALLDALPPGDIQRGSLAMVAREALIQARRYPDADSSAPHLAQEKDPERQALIRKRVVEQTATNVEVLAGAGKTAEAQELSKKFLAFDNSPTAQQVPEQHLARAEREPR